MSATATPEKTDVVDEGVPPVGTVLVHANHGPMRLIAVEERLGEPYLKFDKLGNAAGDLSVMWPAERLWEQSVRRCVDDPEVLFEVLADESPEYSKTWSRRHRKFESLAESGDPAKMAVALRDLRRYDADKGCSHTDRRLMLDTHRKVVSELAVVLGVEKHVVEDRIAEAIGVEYE